MSPWGSGAEPPTPEDRAAWARGEGVEPGEFRTLPAPPPVAARACPVCNQFHGAISSACPGPDPLGFSPERLAQGEADVAAGRVVPFDQVVDRLRVAAQPDPFCPQHGPARASNHAAAGCTCRLDAREEPGARCKDCGTISPMCDRCESCCEKFHGAPVFAPPAPSPDVAGLVDALLDKYVDACEIHENLVEGGNATAAGVAEARKAYEEAKAALLAAFAAQARRAEEAERAALKVCPDSEDESPKFVLVGESGNPIIEADTVAEVIEQMDEAWRRTERRAEVAEEKAARLTASHEQLQQRLAAAEISAQAWRDQTLRTLAVKLEIPDDD